MNSNLKDILQYKTSKEEIEKTKLIDILHKELSKFDFEEDYLIEGSPRIEDASEVTFYTCILENFTDTRIISEGNRPNKSGVPIGYKKSSEFDIWDYKLNYIKEFNNSYDDYEIPESYHAIGCDTCNQHGKIRCSSCSGAGDISCNSCSGRGEKQCTNCNGRVDIKCWSCSGKGIKETGYGENKKTERCSSCSGRGSNKCTRCSSGFVSCTTCSGRGRVTCYTCHGSGEVTCYQCEGYRTMNHYFIVKASFVNLSQNILLTNSYPGFDPNKSQLNNFNIQNKLFDLCENRFKEGYFEKIKTSPFYSQIKSFFDFPNNESSKLVKSRITFFENIYTEITFSFYGDKYILYLDKNLEHSYYGGRKPSDQYELDLLKKALQSSVNNDLDLTKKTIQKLAKYDFIKISEKEIISAIEDAENIYEAYDEYKNKNYPSAEDNIKLVSKIKKSEYDFILLRKKLNRIYLINTLISWLIGLPFLYYLLKDKAVDFVFLNVAIMFGILLFSLLLNRVIKNIHFARFFIIVLHGIHFFLATNYIDKLGNQIKSEDLLLNEFILLKEQNYVVSSQYDKFNTVNSVDSLIFLKPTGVERKNYYLPKGKLYYDWGLDGNGDKYIKQYSKEIIKLDIEDFSDKLKKSYWHSVKKFGTNKYIDVIVKDIKFDDDKTEIEVQYMRNDIQDFKNNITSKLFLTNYEYKKLKSGIKDLTKIKSQIFKKTLDVKDSIVEEVKFNKEQVQIDNANQIPDQGTANVISSRAYFYEYANTSSRSKDYIIKGKQIKYYRKSDDGSFILTDYKNKQGEMIYGWMLIGDFENFTESFNPGY